MTPAQLHYLLAPEVEPVLPQAPHGKRLTGLDALRAGKAG